MKDISLATIPSGARTIVLSGVLDLALRATLAEQLQQAAALSSEIVLDMTAVTHMDSSAITSLIGLHRRLEAQGHGLTLRMRRNAALRLLEITGLTAIFRIDVVE